MSEVSLGIEGLSDQDSKWFSPCRPLCVERYWQLWAIHRVVRTDEPSHWQSREEALSVCLWDSGFNRPWLDRAAAADQGPERKGHVLQKFGEAGKIKCTGAPSQETAHKPHRAPVMHQGLWKHQAQSE